MTAVRRARITSKGQITVPKAIRERLRVQPGDELEFEIRGAYVKMVPAHRPHIAEFARLFPARRSKPPEEARRRGWVVETRRLVRRRKLGR